MYHLHVDNTQVDDAQCIDVVMSMYNLIEYSDNYLKTSGILWQYYRDVLTVHNDDGDDDDYAITDFTEVNAAADSFSLKEIFNRSNRQHWYKKCWNNSTIKYLSNLWRNLKLSLINSEINLGLSSSENCVIVAANVVAQASTFSVTDTKRYVPVVTLSTQDNWSKISRRK